MPSERLTLDAYLAGIRSGDRVTLARAITLAESTRPSDFALAEDLLSAVTSASIRSQRIGITGVPGAGKSTLIERLGLLLIDAGHRVAVLAIDPSSTVTGGSVLGDKTRMPTLSAHSHAFVRPTPAGATLGGVAARTRDVITLCEAAGYDRILVETVGVGQSESAVAGVTDLLLLLTIAGGGDELQGIKRGVLELADVIAVNKADGPNTQAASVASAVLRNALHISSDDPDRVVTTCSAATGDGVLELMHIMDRLISSRTASGAVTARRAQQAVATMHAAFAQLVPEAALAQPGVGGVRARLERDVASGAEAPTRAARALLRALFGELR